MISPNLLEILNIEVEKEFNAIAEGIGSDKAMRLIELTKCVDHCFVATSFIMPKNLPSYQRWADLFQQFSTGWYLVLKMLLGNLTSSTIIRNASSSREQISWANTIMKRAGDLGNLIKLSSLAKSSDFVETKLETYQTMLFYFRGSDIGVEYLETKQQKWLAESRLNKSEPLNDFENVIVPQIKVGVSTIDRETIIYYPHEVIDSFFYAEGRFYGEALHGFDSFTDQSVFGNLPFMHYKEVMMCLIGNALRHLHYCFAFQGKTGYEVINPWNTYTRIQDIYEIKDMICKQTALPEVIVSEILQVVILNKAGLEETTPAPGSAPPPLIKLSDDKVLFSMMGHLSNPMSYLNRILIRKFKADYSVAVNLREEKFKSELYNLFDKSFVTVPHNITIRKDGKVQTDIDAVIFDKTDKIAYLFQLKWMDDWGSDMNQRSSMIKNYRNAVEKWIEAVDVHIEAKGISVFFRDAGIVKNVQDIKIVKVVIGRHFSLFSNLVLPDNSFYLNWATMVKIVSENPQCGISLKSLTVYLNSNRLKDRLKASPPPTKDFEINLGGYTFKTKSKI